MVLKVEKVCVCVTCAHILGGVMQLPNLSALCTIGMNSQDPSPMDGNAQQVWDILGLEEEEEARDPQAHDRDDRAAERLSDKKRREQNTPEARTERAREKRANEEKAEADRAATAAKRKKASEEYKQSKAREGDRTLDALLDDDDGPAAAAPAAAAPAAAAPAAAPEEREERPPRWLDPNSQYFMRL